MPKKTPKKHRRVFGDGEADSLYQACIKKAKRLEIKSPGKYDPESF